MARVIFAWEMGENLGHLTRDLPVAKALRAIGHEVVFAVRNMASARIVVEPENFDFMPAPYAVTSRSRMAPGSYAEILLAHGYGFEGALASLVQRWRSLISAIGVDVMIANHAPTAVLAARCAALPCIATCIGFELPPAIPRPFQSADLPTLQRLVSSEALVLQHVNKVLHASGVPNLSSVPELFSQSHILMTTVPELDHYGYRNELAYIGPIGGLRTKPIAWPESPQKKVFCYLRSTVPDVERILEALEQRRLDTICVLPDAHERTLRRFEGTTVQIKKDPVDISSAVEGADLVVTYGTGTMHDSLLGGRPLLICPQNMEQFLAGARVVALGAGLILPEGVAAGVIGEVVEMLLSDGKYRRAATAFSRKYASANTSTSTDKVVKLVESLTVEAKS